MNLPRVFIKAVFIAITSVSFLLLMTACVQNSQTADTASANVGEPELTGQSGVVDEESEQHILKVALGSKDHTTLVAAVQAAAMEDVLTNAGPLTVFAPTNDAFAALPEGTVENLLKPENIDALKRIITYHAAPGNYGPDNIKGVMGIGQATGDKVEVKVEDGVTTVNGAKVLGSVKASNGYVHVIDAVLLPPDK